MPTEESMVERVARALRAACRKEYGSDWNYEVAWAFARAAIEAMEEPTPEMCDAGMAPNVDGIGSMYRAMLRAALKEPSDE
jgi:hypothetical protein